MFWDARQWKMDIYFLQQISEKMIDKNNWTNFECFVKEKTNKKYKILKHFQNDSVSFRVSNFY
jgi:hypothetical protein